MFIFLAVKRKQGANETLARFRDAIGGRRPADQSPLGSEVRVAGALDARGVAGMQRRCREVCVPATPAELEAAAIFPWRDPLDAVHVEYPFERDAEALGKEGETLWARFDKEMDRPHGMQFLDETCTAEPANSDASPQRS